MSQPASPRPGRAALHITALWALAVAAPLYDVLRQSAEFFIAYRAGRRDILLFVLVVSFLIPLGAAGLVALLRRVSSRLAEWTLTAIVGLLVAAFAAQALQPLAAPAALHIGMSAGFGAIGAALYQSLGVRWFVTWLAPAIVAFPLMFLLDRAIRPMVWPAHEKATIAAAPPKPMPIVFVVFDQLPLTSLMAADGTIDEATYPGFGALARTSTWYRNASTVGELTAWAVPPLLSGRYARPGAQPTVADYPYNLFTALGETYRMSVFEPLTGLCPDAVCPPSAAAQREPRLRPMLFDSSVVMAHRLVPRDLVSSLPPVDEDWRGFAEAQGFQQQWASERERDRRRIIDNFIESISSNNPDATLYFLHALLPHEPYEYMRSGQKAGFNRRTSGIARGRWSRQEWPVAQTYARHLLQVGFVDRSVERLIERLKAQGIFDRALIVVTSDHGVSFAPGQPMKAMTRATAGSVVPVPLFVKRPGQQTGEVNDLNVQSIDVLPLMADLLEVTLPFEVEGRSPLDQAAPRSDTKTIVHAGGRSTLTLKADELVAYRDEMVARRVRWFGSGPGPYWTPLIAPARGLLGKRVDELPMDTDRSLRITLERSEELERLDPQQPILPAVLFGRVRGTIGRSERLTLAIAVNGRIAATTQTYRDLDDWPDGSWNALVNPSVYRPGFNDVRIYVVRGTSGEPTLVEGFRNEPSQTGP